MRSLRLLLIVAITTLFAAPAFAANECVRDLQAFFNTAGFDAGVEDGLYGNKTASAGTAYAQANGLNLPELTRASLPQWCDELVPYEPVTAVLSINGDTSVLSQEDLGEYIRSSEQIIADVFGVTTREAVTFYASSGAQWLTDNSLRAWRLSNRYRNGKLESFGNCDPVAEFAPNAVFLCIDGDSNGLKRQWQERGWVSVLETVAHEYFHTLQGSAAGDLVYDACCYQPNQNPPLGPEWLKEGAAVYAGWVVRDGIGEGVLARRIGEAIVDIRGNISHGNMPDNLSMIERTTRAKYNELGQGGLSAILGAIATHRLVQLTGEAGSIIDFYRHLGFGQSTNEAFEFAFGLSMEEFDELFAQNWTKNGYWKPEVLASL